MAAVCNIARIAVFLLLSVIVSWKSVNYFTKSEVVCYSTLQRRVLEIIHPYIYGLTCGMESDLDQTGILHCIWKLVWTFWQYITGSSGEGELYICTLDWTFVAVEFSVDASWCCNIEDDNIWTLLGHYWALVVYMVYKVLSLIFIYYLYRRRQRDRKLMSRGEVKDDKNDTEVVVREKPKVEKKISFTSGSGVTKDSFKLIKEAYTKRPEIRGIADALPGNLENEIWGNIEGKGEVIVHI